MSELTLDTTVPINVAYRPLYETEKRYILITGGRGSLKSSTVHDFIARLTYEKGHGILFTRYTMTSAEISIIPEFKETLDRLGIREDFDIRRNKITNKRTGSFIYFSGIKTNSGDQSGRLKSIAGITTWVVEEGEDFDDEKTFDKIDDSIRSTNAPNRVIWIQNPTTREHFIYRRFILDTNKQIEVEGLTVTVSDHPQVEHIHTTYRLAEKLGYLNEQWLEKARGTIKDVEDKIKHFRKNFRGSRAELRTHIRRIRQSSYYYYNYIGGWLERAEGAIFDNWVEGEFDESLPYCYGQDYGYSPDPLAMVRVAVDKVKRRIYVDEVIYETKLDDIAGRYRLLGVKKNDLIVVDHNEDRTTAILRSKKRQPDGNRNGWNLVKAAKGAGSIAEDIREIRKYTIVVTKRSANVKKELNNYAWNDERASIPKSGWDHAMDALRYGFRRLVGSRKKGVRTGNRK